MGKVKDLWQAERDKRYQELVKYFRSEGYTREEAEEMAAEDLNAEDEANGQFGVGA